jgi:hypothetical protein
MSIYYSQAVFNSVDCISVISQFLLPLERHKHLACVNKESHAAMNCLRRTDQIDQIERDYGLRDRVDQLKKRIAAEKNQARFPSREDELMLQCLERSAYSPLEIFGKDPEAFYSIPYFSSEKTGKPRFVNSRQQSELVVTVQLMKSAKISVARCAVRVTYDHCVDTSLIRVMRANPENPQALVWAKPDNRIKKALAISVKEAGSNSPSIYFYGPEIRAQCKQDLGVPFYERIFYHNDPLLEGPVTLDPESFPKNNYISRLIAGEPCGQFWVGYYETSQIDGETRYHESFEMAQKIERKGMLCYIPRPITAVALSRPVTAHLQQAALRALTPPHQQAQIGAQREERKED